MTVISFHFFIFSKQLLQTISSPKILVTILDVRHLWQRPFILNHSTLILHSHKANNKDTFPFVIDPFLYYISGRVSFQSSLLFNKQSYKITAMQSSHKQVIVLAPVCCISSLAARRLEFSNFRYLVN